MLTKYMAQIEFRYTWQDADDVTQYKSELCTIGVYDTIEEAVINGNKELEKIDSRFPLNPNYKIKRRFSTKPRYGNLISDIDWVRTPFQIFADIKELKHKDITSTIDNILKLKGLNHE